MRGPMDDLAIGAVDEAGQQTPCSLIVTMCSCYGGFGLPRFRGCVLLPLRLLLCHHGV